jgi:stage V sporulation protein G
MQITAIKVSLVEDPSLKAVATVTFDDCFVVKGIKLILGEQGLFVAMPSRKLPDGTYQDVAFPTTAEMRERLRSLVMEQYSSELTAHAGSPSSEKL